jgi:hypothetical protein
MGNRPLEHQSGTGLERAVQYEEGVSGQKERMQRSIRDDSIVGELVLGYQRLVRLSWSPPEVIRRHGKPQIVSNSRVLLQTRLEGTDTKEPQNRERKQTLVLSER